ncbi:MAG: hypothetical protein A3J76_04665 [Candidatus Moranbacteria bacterium RBG_13_45_13]|nr:MAG: hypothetical protein A3J76_04665 [Candidatus Moranbacteria bacterium RBG_13_45_13]
MENKKNISLKEKAIWLIRAVVMVVVFAMVFFDYLSPLAGGLFFLLLLADSVLLAVLFSDFKKGWEIFDAETQKKSIELQEFDKITRQLVRRELEVDRANQRLAELDAAKSDFISVAAHQLRTPLTGIKWSYTALLDKDTGPLNPDQKEIAEKGLAAIDQSIGLINDLLNVAHLEEGKLDFDFKRQSIVPVAQKAFAGIKLLAEEKNITISSKIPETGFPEINMDAEKMGLVLANLLDNAVKYTPAGGRIEFGIGQDQGLIKIVIQDSGIGIPKNQKGRLFTKFFRADNATGVQTSGTGLGLYMVKNIVERHGGKIAVNSIEGQGATFIITIPEQSAKKK